MLRTRFLVYRKISSLIDDFIGVIGIMGVVVVIGFCSFSLPLPPHKKINSPFDIILFLSIVSTFFVYLYECCLIYPQYGQGDK